MATPSGKASQGVVYYRPPFGVMILATLSVLMGIGIIISGFLLGALGIPFLVGAGILLLLIGAGLILVGYGLYKGREWARMAAIAVYGITVGQGIIAVLLGGYFGIIGAMGFFMILVGIGVILYLNTRSVVDYFEYVKRVGTISGRPPSPQPAPLQPGSGYQAQPAGVGGPTIGYAPPSQGPAAGPTVPGVPVSSGPSYTLVLPNGRTIRVVNEAVKVFGREDFVGVVPSPQLQAITRRAKGGHFKIVASAKPDGTYEYFIEDLGSVNGTYLNGTDIRGSGPRPLKHGDVIGVAGVVNLEFKEL